MSEPPVASPETESETARETSTTQTSGVPLDTGNPTAVIGATQSTAEAAAAATAAPAPTTTGTAATDTPAPPLENINILPASHWAQAPAPVCKPAMQCSNLLEGKR